MMLKHKFTKTGFTMVELTLSMAFIAVLLITVSIITFSIITIYQKGLSIRAVNSTGRELVDEFSRAVASAPAMTSDNLCSAGGFAGANYSACTKDDAYLLTFQQFNGNSFDFSTKGIHIDNPPVYGAFCTGRVSYIWNTGYALNEYGVNQPLDLRFYTSEDPTHYKSFFDATGKYPRLVKVDDPARHVCSSMLNGTYSSASHRDYYESNVVLPEGSVPEEILDSSEDNLTIYDFRIFRRVQHAVTSHSFYAGTFLLATLRGEINITGQGDYCTDEPDDLATDFAYCALNKFNFAMRATGELNDDEKIQNQ